MSFGNIFQSLGPVELNAELCEAPFMEELSGMAIVKVLDMNEQVTNMIKLKFIRNRATLKITNNTHETMTFDKTEMIGNLDLRSLGCYKINLDVLQQNSGKHYHFETADDVCSQFSRFINLLKKEEENSKENYPWLVDKDKMKYMTDREILDTYINLDNSCLTKSEKKEVRNLFYEYRDTFSLRDKIGNVPKHQGRNRCDRQDHILHQNFPCKRGR